ncbi:MAG: hypothetical protein JXR84_01440 [Anaerolineae bacterium]|nr:hypothetical protein [Anaerolineae bacterium]
MNQTRPENSRADLIKRFWWTPLVGLPLAVLLTLGLRDFVRDVFALPLSYILWFAGIIFETVPQIWFWTGLIVIALVIAMRSLDRERQPPPSAPGKSSHPARGQINIWAERVDMLLKGRYSRHRFGYFIGKLILDVLSHEERLSLRELERRLEQGETDVPPVVREYLFSRLRPGYTDTRPSFLTRLKRFFGLEKPLAIRLNTELETIVKYLEDQLEV